MKRTRLSAEIAALELELGVRHARLRVSGQERIERLRAIPPMLLLGGGMAAGAFTGALVSRCSPNVDWLLTNVLRLLRMTGLVMPMLSQLGEVTGDTELL